MSDFYTKSVLTVIAAALVIIAAQRTVLSSQALGQGCGDRGNPCYVATSVLSPIEVRVTR